MDLTIDRDALNSTLGQARSIAARGDGILSHVLLGAKGSALCVTATDTEIALIAKLDAKVKTTGGMAVPAAALGQAIRSAPEPAVRLRAAAGDRLEITSGRATYKIPFLPADDYPRMGDFEPLSTVGLAEADLLRIATHTLPSIDPSQQRHGLNGAFVELTNGPTGEPLMRWVSTDGHRLSSSDAVFTGTLAPPKAMLIPQRVVGLLTKLVGNEPAAVELQFGDGSMRLVRPGLTLWFRGIAGEFPDYREVVPTGPGKRRITVTGSELSAAVKRAVSLMDDPSMPIRLRAEGDEVEVSTIRAVRGDVEDAIPATVEGSAITMGFNAAYLIALCELVPGVMTMSLDHELSPCLVRTDGALFVLMPMRVE